MISLFNHIQIIFGMLLSFCRSSSQTHNSTSHKSCWPSKFLHQNVTSLLWPKTVCSGFTETFCENLSFFKLLSETRPSAKWPFIWIYYWWMDHLVENGILMWTKWCGIRQGVNGLFLVLYSRKNSSESHSFAHFTWSVQKDPFFSL